MQVSAEASDARLDPAIGLGSDDFTLFGLARRFAQDRAGIDARWKQLQREAHPDRFATEGAVAQRLAMQWSVRINEAYQRLRDPVRRAAYLCELAGAPIQAQTNTAMPSAFLMQQMQWREALDEAASAAELDSLRQEVAAARADALDQCARLLDDAQDAAGAAGLVRALMFVERFSDDLETRAETLEQGSGAPR